MTDSTFGMAVNRKWPGSDAGDDGRPDGGPTKPLAYHIDQFEELSRVYSRVVSYGQAMGLDMIQGRSRGRAGPARDQLHV